MKKLYNTSMDINAHNEFAVLISDSINRIVPVTSDRNKIINDVLVRIRNNGDRLKYIEAKISNREWTDINRNFYAEIKNNIETSSPYYEEVLQTATTTKNLSTSNSYTRREISILANNYNEQRGILVDKSKSNLRNVFTIIDPSNKKTKYHDQIDGQFIYYYPLDTGRTVCPLNDTANVALMNILGNNDEAIYMFKKQNKDVYWFLGKYYMQTLKEDVNGNLFFVLKKFVNRRQEKDVAKSVSSCRRQEYKWLQKKKILNFEDMKILVKARTNQGYYRKLLLNRFENRCILTDIRNSELLIASHIKPYSECNDDESIDQNNGLLLDALTDKLFDRGLIGFDHDGELVFSPQIEKQDLLKITNHICRQNLKSTYAESKKYLDYHYKHIFKRTI